MQGLWNLWLPSHLATRLEYLRALVPDAERATLLGTGLTNLEYAHLCEVRLGMPFIGPKVCCRLSHVI